MPQECPFDLMLCLLRAVQEQQDFAIEFMDLMRRLYQSQKTCGWAGESVKIWLHSAAFSLSIP
jgi:hypothetical protein